MSVVSSSSVSKLLADRSFRDLNPTYLMVAALGIAFFAGPLLLLLLVCCTCVIVADRRFIWVFLASSCGLFTLLNASKELAGDLTNYIALLEYIKHVPVSGLFEREIMAAITGSYRVTELGFYLPMWLLSKVFENQRIVIASVATIGIFVPTFIGLVKIAKQEEWTTELLFAVAFFAMFAAINFVQTTHLLRQYIATSIIFLGLAYFLEGRRSVAALLAAAGCAVHNAAAILIADLIVLALLFPHAPRRRLGFGSRLFRTLCMLVMLAASLAAVSFMELQQFSLDESPISPVHFVVVGAFFAIFLVFSGGAGQHRYVHYSKLTFLLVYSLSVGFFVIGIRLFALRYLAYLEWLFGLMLGGILHAMPRERLGRFFFSRWAVIFLTLLIFIGRLQTAPWTYAGSRGEVLAASYFELFLTLGE